VTHAATINNASSVVEIFNLPDPNGPWQTGVDWPQSGHPLRPDPVGHRVFDFPSLKQVAIERELGYADMRSVSVYLSDPYRSRLPASKTEV
jgi:hypothetical protein